MRKLLYSEIFNVRAALMANGSVVEIQNGPNKLRKVFEQQRVKVGSVEKP